MTPRRILRRLSAAGVALALVTPTASAMAQPQSRPTIPKIA
ncbi:hypothetical protein [Kribbella sp. NPDC055071]